ncbi:MAG: hypothetical protein L0191_19260 [Acidobacteria bacterium]|nr:hypothetical protein [Acidobacteriota bacterium]
MPYVDPGAGSIILQVLAAGVLGSLFVMKRWWATVASKVRAGLDRLRRH